MGMVTDLVFTFQSIRIQSPLASCGESSWVHFSGRENEVKTASSRSMTATIEPAMADLVEREVRSPGLPRPSQRVGLYPLPARLAHSFCRAQRGRRQIFDN